LPGMMSALTGLLGARCSTCHVAGNFASDELAAKQTARRHFAMQAMLNRDYFADRNAITCLTCHHGHLQPPTN
ncbi:MAG TPA: photosynthetic reaction center cytochrome c subunit family protein, partial [Thermoanaerobaculia bacterium]|nr:photosynthetic reaction center cytochrome c subunit family protein [Thermoanaerobaculia bacterium]